MLCCVKYDRLHVTGHPELTGLQKSVLQH